jgi:predicted Zn-dependent protease
MTPQSNPTPTPQDKKEEKWQELCRQAVSESDPERLIEIAEQINRALEKRDQRSKKPPFREGHAA